jgi:hypothetical protein
LEKKISLVCQFLMNEKKEVQTVNHSKLAENWVKLQREQHENEELVLLKHKR